VHELWYYVAAASCERHGTFTESICKHSVPVEHQPDVPAVDSSGAEAVDETLRDQGGPATLLHLRGSRPALEVVATDPRRPRDESRAVNFDC
jgi:hypothetical protein